MKAIGRFVAEILHVALFIAALPCCLVSKRARKFCNQFVSEE